MRYNGAVLFCSVLWWGNLLLLLLQLPQKGVAQQQSCTASQFLLDQCLFTFDGECDVDGFLCDAGTDCFDCDPCRQYDFTSCDDCTSNGCVWCTDREIRFCSSPSFVEAFPSSCANLGRGGGFLTTCEQPPADIACTAEQIVQDSTGSDCSFTGDGQCDADGTRCPIGTDCFDCDPCAQYDGTTCEQCTANGCVWCSSPAAPYCYSPSFAEVFATCGSIVQGEFLSSCASDTGACTPEQIKQDSCLFKQDGICDADGGTCPTGTDCVDCDPCTQYDGTSCEECTANGCVWCTNFCYSPSFARVYPGCRYQDKVGEFVTSCDVSVSTCAVTDVLDDPCERAFNGQCEAPSTMCAAGTDCFDCDPCQSFSFVSCEECTTQPGCVWCGKDSLCISENNALTTETNAKLSCSASDYVSSSESCSADMAGTVFQDPLYNAMRWVYDQINVEDAWRSGITGAGIGIRINDEGVDATHPNFSSKFDVDSSCTMYAPVSLDSKHSHGTTCAAISAASSSDSCSVGVAPDSTLSSCRVVGESPTPEAADDSYFYQNMEKMHISSNSYGVVPCQSLFTRQRHLEAGCPFSGDASNSPCLATSSCASVEDWSIPEMIPQDCKIDIILYCHAEYENDVQGCIEFLDLFVGCSYRTLSDSQRQAFIKGITEGRDGKGIVYVFASGNEYNFGSDVNYEGTQNSRYTISTGAVGKNGKHASYSTPGAALFCVAPGGDIENYRNNVVAGAGGGCRDATVGTSFATPVVSGVVALMLQANNDLGWRDVQGILAETSQKTDPEHPSWITNSAGLHHSPLYGFGIVDASAAVDAAKTWENYSQEKQIVSESGEINLAIPEFPSPAVTTSIMIKADDGFVVESVVVYLDLDHSSRGDLDILLTSPGGTESLLAPGRRPENTQTSELWKLMTVRNWGERASGEWSLSLIDRSAGDVENCVDLEDWSLPVNDNGAVIEVTCEVFESTKVCEFGGTGGSFSEVLPGFSGPDDPDLADENGVTPAVGCCACGGGRASSSIQDALNSWTLSVYGHEASPGGTSSGAGNLILDWTFVALGIAMMTFNLIY